MARPKNEELRCCIQFERAEVGLAEPLMSATEINKKLAEKHGVSIQTIWYYLRLNKATDSRVKYTEQERNALCGMSCHQLKVYAAQNGKNFNTLYAVVRRHQQKGLGANVRTEDRIKACEIIGFMDFGRIADLKVFGLPGDAFKTARKAVKSVNGLDLLAPRYLIHSISKKFYALNLVEQQAILTNPKRFLRDNASRITKQWKSSDTATHYFVLVDTRSETARCEGETISTHDTFERAAEAQRSTLHGDGKTITKIVKRFGTLHGSYSRYQPGEPLDKHSPDVMGAVIYDECLNWKKTPEKEKVHDHQEA